MSAKLTPRGVRAMLTRRNVDHSKLTITPTVNPQEVRIEGPNDERWDAVYSLVFDLDAPCTSVAPFVDFDLVNRR